MLNKREEAVERPLTFSFAEKVSKKNFQFVKSGFTEPDFTGLVIYANTNLRHTAAMAFIFCSAFVGGFTNRPFI
jgi:hypothetical protein